MPCLIFLEMSGVDYANVFQSESKNALAYCVIVNYDSKELYSTDR